MAKEANSKDPQRPREIIPPPKSFFREKAKAPSQIPRPETVSSSSVAEELKSLGRGWDDEAEALLRIPASLYRTGGQGATYFSDDQNFGVASVASGLRYGRLGRPESKYGICIYDTSGSVYLVLLDMGRRIIVRERLFCVHDQPPEKDWAAVKDAIRAAAAEASKDEGTIAVFDGRLRTVSLKDLGEGNGP